jgi:hypothetical protein
MEHFAKGSSLGLTAWPRVLGKETSIPEWYALGRYTCDGVSLREEVNSQGTQWEEPGLRISELRRLATGDYEVTLEATLFNPIGNGDRLVTLSYDVLDGSSAVMQSAQRTYKLVAKAKSGENADVVLLLTPAEIDRVSLLRITMTTKPYSSTVHGPEVREPTPGTAVSTDANYAQAAGLRDSVEMIADFHRVQFCKHLGALKAAPCVAISRGFSEIDCAKIEAIQAGGDTLLISDASGAGRPSQLGNLSSRQVGRNYYDAYLCGTPILPPALSRVQAEPGPAQTGPVGKVRVYIAPDDSAAAGCTFLGTASDPSLECPDAIKADRAKCLGWKGSRMRGNLVVDSTPPRIYRCPETPRWGL